MNKNGQSIIEYILITTLVLVGIVFMGPYVLRSINAHFKLWDEGVRDSFEETINQAPVNDIPANSINTNCQCTPIVGSCGSNQATSLCAPNQREIDYDCNPLGCGGTQYNSHCTSDPIQGYPSCCSGSVNIGCGSLPTNEAPTATNCPYGDEIQQNQCAPTNAVTCSPNACSGSNTNNCCPLPQCTGFVTPNSVSFCATKNTTPPASSDLTQDTAITYVDNASACPTSGATCQAYCNPPYVLNSAGTACQEPPFIWWQVIMPTNCGCPKSGDVTMTGVSHSEYTCCLADRETGYDGGGKFTLGYDASGTYTAHLSDGCSGAQVMGMGYCVADPNYQCPGSCNILNKNGNVSGYQCPNCSYTATTKHSTWRCPTCDVDGSSYQSTASNSSGGAALNECPITGSSSTQPVIYQVFKTTCGGYPSCPVPSNSTLCNPNLLPSSSASANIVSTCSGNENNLCAATCDANYTEGTSNGKPNNTCTIVKCAAETICSVASSASPCGAGDITFPKTDAGSAPVSVKCPSGYSPLGGIFNPHPPTQTCNDVNGTGQWSDLTGGCEQGA